MKNDNRFIKIWLSLFFLLIAIALLTPSAEAATYTIITTNTIEANSTKLDDFVTYKTSQGFSVEVITEDEYTTGSSCDTRANNIRAWLVTNYLSKVIEYVLLIGNPDPTTFDSNTSIPMKMCWPRNNAITDPGYDESPTDMYYADLTGNWDLDGDGRYGEHGTQDGNTDDFGAGGVDQTPEVYVGRIPYYGTIADLDSILQKIIDYPKANGNWYKSALLPMSFSDATTDGAYLGEYIIDDILTPNSHSKYTLYQQGTYGYDSTFSSDAELLGGAVAIHWAANDYGFVAWWAHGSQTSASVYGDGTLLQSSDCSSLDDDHPAFVLQISCTNGYPENSSNLGYSLLKQGAIATISASRVSWYAVTSWYPALGYVYGDNTSYAYYIMKKMIAEDKTVGEANFWCRENFELGWPGASFMNCTDFNIYGDPATSLSTFTITFATNPTDAVAGATITPAVEVTVKDAYGNTDTTHDGTEITLAINNNPGSGTLLGTKTQTVASGVATFNDLSINKAGTGYTLEATATGFTSTTSGAFNITYSTATKLGYTVQPSNTNYGATITPAVKVAVQDEYGNTVTSVDPTSITIAITTNPSEGTLSGTPSRNTSSGIATFDDFSIDKTGTGYTLEATVTTGLTSTTSNSFNITTPSVGGGGGGGGGSCLIATAAYTPHPPPPPPQPDSQHTTHPHPSSLVPRLEILRQFRDQRLLTNKAGRAFIRLYNKVSPPVAEFIRDKEPLKAVVRFYLKPVVWAVEKTLK